MKIDQTDINALKFAILCNFTPFCGVERAKEAVEIVRELERLAEIGRAFEYLAGIKQVCINPKSVAQLFELRNAWKEREVSE